MMNYTSGCGDPAKDDNLPKIDDLLTLTFQ